MKVLALAIVSVLLAVAAFADSDEHADFSEAQAIIDSKAPYEQLTDAQFEILGDYFMDLMTGDNHEFMDRMMGGEGSEHLRTAHINMGRNFYREYLQTGTVPDAGMMPGMMGGMMGSSMMRGNSFGGSLGSSMMGSSFGYMMLPGSGHFLWGMGFIGVIIMVAFWLLVIWLIYHLVQKTKAPAPKTQPTALEILKARYAKGELTRKRYEEMKKQLQ